MTLDQIDLEQAELNDLLDAYERARAVEGDVDLRDCLPGATRPLYLDARRELVRLDLEYSWQNRRPKRIAVYVAMFPDLLDDEPSTQGITFEEYRLRVLAGENPSAAEYAQLYGVDTARWPGSDADFANYPSTMIAEHVLAEAREEDQDTVVNRMATPPLEWDMFEEAGLEGPASLSGETAKALLQQNSPHSSAEVSVLLAQALTSLPGVGAHFLNFHLIAELGRGSFGCVYLARQSGLANRLVALKLTVDLQGEEQKLAQLQHTNVVPVYSAHKSKTMHAVCMPYFGPTTLADVIRCCREKGMLPSTGACLVETLQARMTEFLSQTAARADVPATGGAMPAALKMLEQASYVNAVLWLGERVTEGLMHAHEHGILHGDLKPANILLTEEGQPMLLDFNLATDIKVRAALGELRVGGTLPYMAPEHLGALQGGDKRNVDARSDVYALGVILFELLTGKLPFETKRGPLAETLPAMIAERMQRPPRLRPHNPAITPAVESIVRHCLEPDPARRYPSAQALHEDLQRHGQDLPLKFAPEPSLRERTGKWMRRHPHLTAPTNVIIVCFVVLAALLAPGAWQAWEDWQADRLHLAKAQIEVDQTKKKLVSLDESARETQKKLQSAEQARDDHVREEKARHHALSIYRNFHGAVSRVRDLVDRVTLVRMRPDTWSTEGRGIQQRADECRALLQTYRVLEEPDWQANSNVIALPDVDQDGLRVDVGSVLFALAEAELLHANRLRGNDATAVKDHLGFVALVVDAMAQARVANASKWNAQALQCFPADELPRALVMQQAKLASLVGQVEEARLLTVRAENWPVRKDTDDAYWSAAALAAEGQVKKAEALVDVATRQAPNHFGAWRLRALCQQTLGDFRAAETDGGICVTLKPDDEWAHYCRGQVRLHLRKWSDARADFDIFLKKHPNYRDAYAQRAAAWEGLASHPETITEDQKEYRANAIADLTKALDLSPGSPELLFQRVELMEKINDKEGANRDRIRLLSTEPAQVDGWIYRGMIQAKNDPKAALADLEQALVVDPNNVVALYQKALLLADRLDRPVEAVGALNRLLRTDPKHADALLKRGLLYAKAGIRDDAIANVERALKCELTPARSYQAACIFAFTSKESPGDRERVIDLLKSALRNGYANDQAKDDPNLPLAHIPEAAELLRAAPFLGPGTSAVKE